ncbi:hypothetical protein ACMFMF_007348 [Clarireedia jacksonii]
MDVGRSAPRYQMMALLYSKSKSLQSSLSEYFIVVVHLCHHMLNLTQRSIIGQFVSSLNDSRVKTLQSELDSWGNSIKEEVTLSMGQKIEDEGQENSRFRALSTIYSETASRRAKLKMNLRVLGLCSTYDYETTWKQIRKRGNATLFNNNTEYQNWKNETKSCTLIYRGKLGSGKSVLLANIVEDLNLHFRDKRMGLGYFFCRHDILESLKARTVIGSLTRQLLSSIPDLSMVGDILATSPTLDLEAISSLLHRALPYNYNLCLVIDGLDECSSSERAMVEQELQALQSRSTVLLCVSSRIEADDAVGKSYNHLVAPSIISLPDDNPDIEGFISVELEHCIKSRKLEIGDPTLILEIEDALLRGAQGMFLWVALQIEALCAEKTDKAIRQALKNLPRTLSETFSRILAKSLPLAESYQTRILKLVTVANRPLTTEELREAVSVNPGNTNWNPELLLNDLYSTLTCCGSLVIVDEEEMTVRLVHHSVKSFLLSSAQDTSRIPFTAASAEREMADVIITYLNYGIFDTQVSTAVVPQISAASAPSRIIDSTLASSSSVRWIALKLLKSKKQPNCDMSQILSEATKHLQSKSAEKFHFYDYAKSNWLKHIWGTVEKRTTNYNLLLKLFERKILDVDTTDEHGQGPLSWAIIHGEDKAFELLLDHKKIAAEWNRNVAIMWWAIENGHLRLLKLMLEKGANPELKYTQHDNRTVLSLVAEHGYDLVVSLLLEYGAQLDSSDRFDKSPLWWAVNANHATIARLLLDKGADPEGGIRQPPLVIAAESGRHKIVELLLEKRAQIDPSSHWNRTALSYAAGNGHKQVVRILLEKGAKIESKDDSHRTALSYTAGNGHEQVVRILLEKGAKIESKDDSHRTVLSHAAENGHEQVVRILLEKGAQIEPRDKSNRTALLYAAENGHEQVVRILLEKGAEVESRGRGYRTVLSYAAENGHEQVVRILLEKGAQVQSRDNNGDTALSYAAENGHEQVVRILLEKGAEVESRGRGYRTVLSYAAENGHEQVVRILLEEGAYIESRDSRDYTVLSYAAENGHEQVVRILLEKGAEVESRDNLDRTVLSYAAENGHEQVVRILLEKGAEVESRDNLDRTVLLYAAENGHEQVVRILLEKGAQVQSRHNNGDTALSCAERKGHKRVVQILLEKGAQW